MAGSVTGDWGIVERFVQMCMDYLPDTLSYVADSAGVTFALPLPSKYVKDASFISAQKMNAIQIYVENSQDEPGQFFNYDAPIRREVDVVIKIYVGDPDISNRDQARDIYGRAVSRVIQQYWRADGNPAVLTGVSTKIMQGSSQKRQDGIVGMEARSFGKLKSAQTVMDPIEIVVSCRQRTEQPVKLS